MFFENEMCPDEPLKSRRAALDAFAATNFRDYAAKASHVVAALERCGRLARDVRRELNPQLVAKNLNIIVGTAEDGVVRTASATIKRLQDQFNETGKAEKEEAAKLRAARVKIGGLECQLGARGLELQAASIKIKELEDQLTAQGSRGEKKVTEMQTRVEQLRKALDQWRALGSLDEVKKFKADYDCLEKIRHPNTTRTAHVHWCCDAWVRDRDYVQEIKGLQEQLVELEGQVAELESHDVCVHELLGRERENVRKLTDQLDVTRKFREGDRDELDQWRALGSFDEREQFKEDYGCFGRIRVWGEELLGRERMKVKKLTDHLVAWRALGSLDEVKKFKADYDCLEKIRPRYAGRAEFARWCLEARRWSMDHARELREMRAKVRELRAKLAKCGVWAKKIREQYSFEPAAYAAAGIILEATEVPDDGQED